MKVETFAHLQERLPERIVEKAIKGMLPHNALGRQLFRKLKVYKGAEHPHGAQQQGLYCDWKTEEYRGGQIAVIERGQVRSHCDGD